MPDLPSAPRVARRLEAATCDSSPVTAPAIAPGTKLANPGTLPTNTCEAIAVHRWANYLAVGQSASAPFFHVYQWDDRAAGGFGSRIAPASPGCQVYSLAGHPNGRFAAVGHANSPSSAAAAFPLPTARALRSPSTRRTGSQSPRRSQTRTTVRWLSTKRGRSSSPN